MQQGNRVLIGFAVVPDQFLRCSHFRWLNHTLMPPALADVEPNWTEFRYREGRR